MKVPFAGEIFSLLAVKDVMYRQTTAVRRRLLNVRYRIAQDRHSIQADAQVLDDALRGTTIQINRSPFELLETFLNRNDNYADRARAAIDRLRQYTAGNAEAYWEDEGDANSHVKTTLSRIDPSRAQSLIAHAYILTMVNSHVLLDYPLLAIPTQERFAWLLGDD